MAEYIEREAALRVLCDACGNAACPKSLIPRCSYYEKMQSIPAADVRPVVRAFWVGEKDGIGICSNCKRLDHIDPLATHCRYYGAEMIEKTGR